MARKYKLFVTSGLVAAISFSSSGSGQQAAGRLNLDRLKTEGPRMGVSSQQILAAMTAVAHDEWQPKVAGRTRGTAETLYARVAPSVVVVRTDYGHGTGFMIDEDGWVLTNQHVVEDAEVDLSSGTRAVSVYLGRIQAGLIALDERPLKATVFKSDSVRDLALIRLPAGHNYRAIPLTASSPSPGSDCVAIGHPRSGALWTIRSCEVAGIARWPAEMIEVVINRLASTNASKAYAAALKSGPQRQVLLSTCGLNPGDSGGPLVNGAGELIGVSFAIPRGGTDEGISLDKFSYHVHVSEVRAFLGNRPSKPPIFVPNPWPPALSSAKVDLDKDGHDDALVFSLDNEGTPSGFLLDLQQKSDPSFDPGSFEDPATQKLWRFDFGMHLRPNRTLTFYDTAGTGTVDLVLVDANGDGKADATAVLEKGSWSWRDGGSRRLVDLAIHASRRTNRRTDPPLA